MKPLPLFWGVVGWKPDSQDGQDHSAYCLGLTWSDEDGTRGAPLLLVRLWVHVLLACSVLLVGATFLVVVDMGLMFVILVVDDVAGCGVLWHTPLSYLC
jgi:hypothetical protein